MPGQHHGEQPAVAQARSAEFSQTARRWLLMPDADSLMELAIFIDAHAVCGDAQLLERCAANCSSW